jgi:hypothetical protein
VSRARSPRTRGAGAPFPSVAFASLPAMSLRVAGLFLLLHVLAGWIFLHDCGPGFPLDDAWGHAVYARALATGDGFAYNAGEPEAGVTSPLWTIFAAVPVGLLQWLGDARPDWGMRLLGALCGWLAALVGYRLAARAGKWPAAFAGVLLSIDPLMLAGRYSGMELPLFALLTLLLAEALLDENLSKAGLATGLAILTRPEALILVPLCVALLWHHRRRMLTWALPVLLCTLPFAGWNFWVAGHPWPNTWQIKSEVVLDLPAIGRALVALARDTGWGWGLLVLVIAGAFAMEGGARRTALVIGCLGLVLLGGVLFTRAMPTGFDPPRVPFYWERYALVAWPPLLVLLGAGLASFVRTAWAGLFCRPLAAALLIAPLAGAVVLSHGAPAHAAEVRRRFAAECADVEALNVAAGEWIAANLPAGALVAAHDAGAIRYFGQRPVLDIHGNNDHRLNALIAASDRARSPAVQAAAGEAIGRYLAERSPYALAVFPAVFAAAHSPEHAAIMAGLDPAERAAFAAQAQDYAGPLGLTRRVATFHVPYPAVVESPLHQHLAIFVRP